MNRAALIAVTCALVSCRAAEELPKPHAGPAADPDELAMQLAVLERLVSTERSPVVCLKIWPLNASPLPLPVSFTDLPDPAESLIGPLRRSHSKVLAGSACRVTRSGSTVTATGEPASAVILHGLVSHGASGEIVVDLVQGIDGERLYFRLTRGSTGIRAELSPPGMVATPRSKNGAAQQ